MKFPHVISGATKAGGGTQGREVKSKAVKNKYKKGKGGNDSDEEEGGGTIQKVKVSYMAASQLIGCLVRTEEMSPVQTRNIR